MSPDQVSYRQLLPQARDAVSSDELLDALFSEIEPPPERPYTIVNFISSIDGRATIKGRSGGLGDDGDKALFHGLRERADAVLAGPMTMLVERYGRILGKPERRQRRVERGQSAEPLACTLTRSGEIPTEIPLFSEPEARVVVFGPSKLRDAVERAAANVELHVLDPGELTLTAALKCLREVYGVRTLLCEGGPRIFGGLLREQLADELFVTIAPKLAGGGDGPAITSGPEPPEPATAHVRWLLERENGLFVRYALDS
jgi:riboflavin biosynthesis pyrimidine reductase